MPTTDAATDRAFTLRMPPDLAAALREQAQAHDRSQGAEVRTILREHLAPHEQSEPTRDGLVEGMSA